MVKKFEKWIKHSKTCKQAWSVEIKETPPVAAEKDGKVEKIRWNRSLNEWVTVRDLQRCSVQKFHELHPKTAEDERDEYMVEWNLKKTGYLIYRKNPREIRILRNQITAPEPGDGYDWKFLQRPEYIKKIWGMVKELPDLLRRDMTTAMLADNLKLKELKRLYIVLDILITLWDWRERTKEVLGVKRFLDSEILTVKSCGVHVTPRENHDINYYICNYLKNAVPIPILIQGVLDKHPESLYFDINIKPDDYLHFLPAECQFAQHILHIQYQKRRNNNA